ncbi:MAG: hypothetical protein M1820_006991 [Bogoriella megaspora]|nr:MAG: hypothetical protein M1820_006991 [Bogoriella megaspora]
MLFFDLVRFLSIAAGLQACLVAGYPSDGKTLSIESSSLSKREIKNYKDAVLDEEISKGQVWWNGPVKVKSGSRVFKTKIKNDGDHTNVGTRLYFALNTDMKKSRDVVTVNFPGTNNEYTLQMQPEEAAQWENDKLWAFLMLHDGTAPTDSIDPKAKKFQVGTIKRDCIKAIEKMQKNGDKSFSWPIFRGKRDSMMREPKVLVRFTITATPKKAGPQQGQPA